VLLHEIGHVWGLCDLYDSAQLCDPRHAGDPRLGAGDYAAMGPVFVRQQLYLANDDVYGIRALALRPGFDAGWKVPRRQLEAALPAPPLPPVEIFSVRVAKREAKRLLLAATIVTNRPARYSIELRSGGSRWRSAGTYGGTKPIHELSLTMDLSLPDAAARTEVRVRLEHRDARGAWSKPLYVTPGK
jgi:hypothetical protein